MLILILFFSVRNKRPICWLYLRDLSVSLHVLPVDLCHLVTIHPALVFDLGFAVCETADVSHEHPGQCIHGHTTTLNYEHGSRRNELTVQHVAADKNAHEYKQQNEKNVYRVSQEAVVAARVFQEPARLEERVCDLAAKQHGARLDARLPQPQSEQNTQDAHGVVSEHHQALCAEVHTPGHVKDKVAQTDHHSGDLKRGVLCTWVGERPRSIYVSNVSSYTDCKDAME